MYNFDIIAKQIGLPNGFFIGPGAGNSHAIGRNCEVYGRNNFYYPALRDKMISGIIVTCLKLWCKEI